MKYKDKNKKIYKHNNEDKDNNNHQNSKLSVDQNDSLHISDKYERVIKKHKITESQNVNNFRQLNYKRNFFIEFNTQAIK